MANLKSEREGTEVYELCFLILPSLAEDQLAEILKEIRQVIGGAGGEEIDAEAPFKQRLAYSMSQTIGASRYVLDEAYLGWIKFEVESSKILALKMAVEKIEAVFRILLVKAPRQTSFTFAEARSRLMAPILEEAEVPTSNLNQSIEKEKVLV